MQAFKDGSAEKRIRDGGATRAMGLAGADAQKDTKVRTQGATLAAGHRGRDTGQVETGHRQPQRRAGEVWKECKV